MLLNNFQELFRFDRLLNKCLCRNKLFTGLIIICGIADLLYARNNNDRDLVKVFICLFAFFFKFCKFNDES